MINKIDELEKIKSLKDNGSITEQEFEVEKQKILNSDNNSNTNNTEGTYIASLVLGICSFIFGIVPIVGLILAIIGLVISKKSRKKLKVNNEKKGIVTAGFILSIIGLIISILSIIFICLGIIVAILTGENGILTSAATTSAFETEAENETSKIEIGINYNYNDDNTIAFIRFNTETDFIMEIGYIQSENFTKTGAYSINQDTIKLTVNYDSAYSGYSELEEKFNPYTEEIIILGDGKLQYTTKDGATIIFEKENTNSDIKKNNIDEIYQKYPNLKDKEGIICTDGDNYWLLDKEGKKIYFQDLESFESALKQCDIEIRDTENTSNDSNSSSENHSNNNDSTVNNNYSQETSSQQDSNYANKSNQIPSKWTTNVLIPNEFKVSYNGKDCIAKSSAYNQNRGYYICYLENPEQNDNAAEGAKFYMNGKSLENGIWKENLADRYAYKYTFNNIKNVTFKIVAPYLYDVDSEKVVKTNVTVFEKAYNVEELYNNSHNTGEDEYIKLSIPTIWGD